MPTLISTWVITLVQTAVVRRLRRSDKKIFNKPIDKLNLIRYI